LLKELDWLLCRSQAGLCKLFQRIGIRYKRGRHHIHSPDADYEPKIRAVCDCLRQAVANPDQHIVLFLDELSYYRQPSLARAYAARGHSQALAHLSCRANTPRRILGAVNALTGQVHYLQRSRVTVATLVDFYDRLRQAYPTAETLWLCQDNWPVHFHPDLLAALQPQRLTWPRHTPGNWRIKPRRKARRLNLPIQLVALPTYAPWTNPIEKLWRWLKQQVIHHHPYADDLDQLTAQVAQFLERFDHGSEELLRYIGLRGQGRYAQTITSVSIF
jgi:hypothetical protein